MRLLPIAAVLLVATTAAAQEPQRYRWHTADPGVSVQYGVPDTDDRALRIDCVPGGAIEIAGPTSTDGEGDATTVTLSGKTYKGQLMELGDGTNFNVRVGRADPVIKALLAGKAVTVTEAGQRYSIPGKGAPAHLTRLLNACR